MSHPSTYNGWKNYETWCFKLWLDNDESSHNYWTERAREYHKESLENGRSNDYWTNEEFAQFNLADQLKEWAEENNPLGDDASMWTDLLNAALSEIDWVEIAQAYLEGMN